MNLLIQFDDNSESFVLGVEYGRILSLIEQGLEMVNNSGFPIHIDNVDVIKQTCHLYGYTPVFGDEYYGQYVQFHALKDNRLN